MLALNDFRMPASPSRCDPSAMCVPHSRSSETDSLQPQPNKDSRRERTTPAPEAIDAPPVPEALIGESRGLLPVNPSPCTSGCGLRYSCSMKRRKHSPKTRRSSGEEPDAGGLMVGELLRQTVRDQIKANEPPEVAATYRRLIAEGHDATNALELITAVLAAEMYDIMNEQRDFDETKPRKSTAAP